ncbi:Alpha/Beta hydrolase protein [Podospora australis]|uniref:Carboxylic ester hydrolase n=1 Tax=Podospora australis TaxID=1536484 RepID=A0AAN6X3A6_9PEZI|nr:Alpha/Beta hydrolase protein [Podospora australis]
MKFSLTSGLLAALAGLSSAASLTQVSNFGSNPSGARMYIYVPDRLASNPAIVTAVHYCTGTANAFYTGTPYARLADQHGFIVIYPESPNSGGCWDVSSQAAYTRNSGSNSHAIATMVNWAISQYGADRDRIFLAGTSSGAMMTNVLAATYPDLFKAASAYAGVPAGCFSTNSVAGWNSTCANGQSITTQEHWAQVAKNMYPGYDGPRPRMMIYHGSADSTIYPRNFNETMKQWAGVFGYTYGSPQQTLNNNPAAPYTKYVYGANLVGVYGTGVTHDIPVNGAHDMEWFGITGQPAASSSPAPVASSTTLATSTRAATSAAVTPTQPSGCTAARWAQCGGQGFSGCTVCASPYKCTFSNNWYSQCL